jgi:ABC-type Fe3+ transport system permease subunit
LERTSCLPPCRDDNEADFFSSELPDRLMKGLRSIAMRRRSGWGGFIPGLILALPLCGLLLAAWVDRGAAGEVRLSLFSAALVVLDPYTRTCVRNSTLFAAVVSGLSLVLGVALGWVIASRRFWGRPLLGATVVALLVVSPAFHALGILGLFGPVRAWAWPHGDRATPPPVVSLEDWSGLSAWLLWLWTTLPGAAALVTVTTALAVRGIAPSVGDAARLCGASRFQSWRAFCWPLIRPHAARGAAWTFLLALVEPGAPLVLGLRRTLGFQIVESTRRPQPFPAAAALCLLAGLIGLAGWALLRAWGGPMLGVDRTLRRSPSFALPRSQTRSLLGACACGALLAGWALVSWMPVVGLFLLGLRSAASPIRAASAPVTAFPGLVECISSPPAPSLITNSALLGVTVACTIIPLGWVLYGWPRARSDRPFGRCIALVGMAPPLVRGISILTLPWLLELAAAWLQGFSTGVPLGRLLSSLSAMLDPYRDNRPLLVASVIFVLAPLTFELWSAPRRTRAGRVPSASDAARLYGASALGHLRLLAVRPFRVFCGQFILVFALAATNLTPALLFQPWSDQQTLSPAVLVLCEGPDNQRRQAAALALVGLVSNLVAVAVARATGSLRALDEIK